MTVNFVHKMLQDLKGQCGTSEALQVSMILWGNEIM